MTTADDHRHAGRLMVNARTQALALLNHTELDARSRAVRSLVFIEEAARLWPKRYSDAEARRVVARFEAACAQLAAAGGE